MSQEQCNLYVATEVFLVLERVAGSRVRTVGCAVKLFSFEVFMARCDGLDRFV